MSQTPATTASSSNLNFRTIFVAALKAYEKKTKTDLLTHPLATQLQSCNSSRDVLAVLHDKVNEFVLHFRHARPGRPERYQTHTNKNAVAAHARGHLGDFGPYRFYFR